MQTDEVKIGMRVRYKAVAGRSVFDDILLTKAKWYPPTGLTGRVQKVFKNGKVSVAIDQGWNKSADHKKEWHFPATELEKVTS